MLPSAGLRAWGVAVSDKKGWEWDIEVSGEGTGRRVEEGEVRRVWKDGKKCPGESSLNWVMGRCPTSPIGLSAPAVSLSQSTAGP